MIGNLKIGLKNVAFKYLKRQYLSPERIRTFIFFVGAMLVANLSLAQNSKLRYDVVVHSVNIVNTYSGKVTESQSIAIRGDSIVAIADSKSAGKWKAKKHLRAAGKYVIPGLWDMHVHFGGGDTLIDENKNLLPLFIANGITTVRDCAADLSPQVLAWRREIREGTLVGPTIFTSGPKIEGKNSIWPGDQEIDNETELAQALDSLDKLDVDFVKITDSALSPELFLKSVAAAHARGYKVSGHIPFVVKLETLSEAGLSTVEHMSYMLKAGAPREDEILTKVASGELKTGDVQKELIETFDPERAARVYARLKTNGTAIVPTLIGTKIISYLDEDNHQHDQELKYLGKGLIGTYSWRVNRANQANQDQIDFRKESYQKLVSLLPVIKKSGMDIIAGTDAGFLNSFIYLGFALHKELQIFVQGGLTPLEALQTSVINGPKYFGLLDQYGTVEVGKKADLLFLNASPVGAIEATEDRFALIRAGKVYTRKDLDRLLTEVEKIYKK